MGLLYHFYHIPSFGSNSFIYYIYPHQQLTLANQDHDAIDFTDNDINSLSNFPLFPRLRTLLLARNRVSNIQPTLSNSIPNLTALVLTSNNLAELADLDALRGFRRLIHLVLCENPVAAKEVRSRPRSSLQSYVFSEVRSSWSSLRRLSDSSDSV